MEQFDEFRTILSYYDDLSFIHNGEIFEDVIEEFKKRTKINIDTSCKLPYEIKNSEKKVKDGVVLLNKYAFNPEYAELIYKILNQYKYYMGTFIKDAIRVLGNLEDPNKNSNIIRDFLNLPFIQDITFDSKNTFKIFSEKYGEFIFLLADRTIKDSSLIKNKVLLEYINSLKRTAENLKDCHGHATNILNRIPNFYTITSLCANYFVEGYYHSYSYIKSLDMVLDLTSNIFMDKKIYDSLYKPIELVNMRNDKLIKYFTDYVKDIETSVKCDLLKVAIYNQLSNMSEQEKRKFYSINNFTY